MSCHRSSHLSASLVPAVVLSLAAIALAPLPGQSPAAAESSRTGERRDQDREIARTVQDLYRRDESVAAHLVDVDVRDGVLVLSGSVDNLRARERASELAEVVRGVRSIVNRIGVRPVPISDATLRRDVDAALIEDAATEGYDVDVDVEDGVATLSGELRSWTEKQLALYVAKGVRGVRDVQDRLRIAPAPARSDAEIRKEIERRLEIDAWIASPDIDLEVADGAVSVSGRVGSAAERRRVRWASHVAGVRSVDVEQLEVDARVRDPDIRTRRPRPDDAAIERAMRDALRYEPRVFSARPDVEVREGAVTLSGSVPSLTAKRAVEEIARDTIGVWRVRSYLRVRPRGEHTDAAIAERVRASLRRSPYVEADAIDVSVRNAKVRLAGDVASPFVKYEAGDIAAAAKGVVAVQNDLRGAPRDAWLTESDRELRSTIERRLGWHAFLDAEAIEVNVVAGVTTLTGEVDTLLHRWMAADAARRAGAERVINNLSMVHEDTFAK